MISNRVQINSQTVVVVTDRDQGVVHAIRVYLSQLHAEEGEALQAAVTEQLVESMRRLAESPRGGGPDRGRQLVESSLFQGGLHSYLLAWCHDHRRGLRGDWSIEVPIRLHRLWESEEVDPVRANVIERITIDARPRPPHPPGRIDTLYERVDEVLERLEQTCGGRDPMSRLIRRWRNGHLTESQAQYLDESTARRYAAMSDRQPSLVFQHTLDLRNLFERRVGGEAAVELRVQALEGMVSEGINPANRFIHAHLLLVDRGGQVQPQFVPDRLRDLKTWVRRQAETRGTVYAELREGSPSCHWQNINFYSLLDD